MEAANEFQASLSDDGPPASHSIKEDIMALEKRCIELNEQGLYDEATVAKAQLSQLRTQLERRLCEELNLSQIAKQLRLDDAHMRELRSFNEDWDQRIADYDEHAASLEATLAERHREEHEAYLEKLQKEVMPQPKWSRDLLNLRKIQETACKQKNYDGAAAAMAEADRIEAKEHAAWKAKRDAKTAGLEEKFLHKQQLEMNGLLKRIHLGREEQRQARKSEMGRLMQRYHNIKSQLQTQQKILQQRVEKNPLASLSVSRPRGSFGA